MHTNVHDESTEYTEETEKCLTDVGNIANDTMFKYDMFIKNDQISLRLLGGLSSLREAGNDVMRKIFVKNKKKKDN